MVEIPESPARKDKKGSMDEEKNVKHRVLLLHAHCQVHGIQYIHIKCKP